MVCEHSEGSVSDKEGSSTQVDRGIRKGSLRFWPSTTMLPSSVRTW